jgi:FkbM family methyltransferase
MKFELGWYFPDGETHLPGWIRAAQQLRDGVLQYQLRKYEMALGHVRQRRLAVDVGGHIGQWSHNMAKDFATVQAFEPVPAYAECWRKNLEGVGNAHLHELALGAAHDMVSLRCGTPGSHGDTFVAPREQANAARDVPMLPLDDFGLSGVDLIKIDCEGYELFVIRGAEATIRRCQPCVIVEQKPGHAGKYGLGETDAVGLLESWGARRRATISGDYILSWD